MSRVAGSLDGAKRKAILTAAAEVLSLHGPDAAIASVARQAGVSKQTIYNHFGSKSGLFDALIEGRTSEFLYPLLAADDADPAQQLQAYALALLRKVAEPGYRQLLRATFFSIQHDPDRARRLYLITVVRERTHIADYFRREAGRGRLAVDDPEVAAALFYDAVAAHAQMMILAGIFDARNIQTHASACATLFAQAYGALPDPEPPR